MDIVARHWTDKANVSILLIRKLSSFHMDNKEIFVSLTVE